MVDDRHRRAAAAPAPRRLPPPPAAAACRCLQPTSMPLLCAQLQAFGSRPPQQSSWTRTASRCPLCGFPGAAQSRLPLLRLLSAPCTPLPLLCTALTLLLHLNCSAVAAGRSSTLTGRRCWGGTQPRCSPPNPKRRRRTEEGWRRCWAPTKRWVGRWWGVLRLQTGHCRASTARLSLPGPAVDSRHTAGLCRCLSKQNHVCRCPHAGLQFISETELQEIKSTMGLRPEDGTIAADKPLAEVGGLTAAALWHQQWAGRLRPLRGAGVQRQQSRQLQRQPGIRYRSRPRLHCSLPRCCGRPRRPRRRPSRSSGR